MNNEYNFESTYKDCLVKVLDTVLVTPNIVCRKELIKDESNNKFTLNAHYDLKGNYIGGGTELLNTFPFFKDIDVFEKVSLDSNKCSIGFNEKEQKWYGWSHRAYFGFEIGSEVKFGDCAYMPNNEDNLIKWHCNFWDINGKQITYTEHSVTYTLKEVIKLDETKYVIQYTKQKHDKNNNLIEEELREDELLIPEVWGKGEWTALSLSDAKQMAIDYAKSVN